MELRGDFSSYEEVLELLQIISLGKKTGEVNLRNQTESIAIQFKDGNIVNFKSNIPIIGILQQRVKNGELSLKEAAKSLLHYINLWDKGKFNFVEKEITSSLGSADTTNVMMDFTKEQDELSDKIRKILKENKIYSLSEKPELPLTLEENAWKLLVYLSRGIPVRDVILSKCQSFGSGAMQLEKLFKRNLIEEVKDLPLKVSIIEENQDTKPVVSKDKLDKIKSILIETMGPMGEFLIDETLEDMEISQLTTDLIPQFIETLIEKIPEGCVVDGENCKEKLKLIISSILEGGSHES